MTFETCYANNASHRGLASYVRFCLENRRVWSSAFRGKASKFELILIALFTLDPYS